MKLGQHHGCFTSAKTFIMCVKYSHYCFSEGFLAGTGHHGGYKNASPVLTVKPKSPKTKPNDSTFHSETKTLSSQGTRQANKAT